MSSSWRTARSMPRSTKPQSEAELRLRATSLIGARVQDVAAALGWPLPVNEKAAKGYIGQLIEAALGSDEDAHERPDFVALNIECKTLPLAWQASKRWHPTESTFVCSIRLLDAASADWHKSRVRHRLSAVLWVALQSAKCAALPQRKVLGACIWRPCAMQWQRLRADWEDLMGAIGAGRGHSLGAQEGEVLQVRPKAATSAVRALGPTADGLGAMLPLGFYLRPSFVAEIVGQIQLPNSG